MTCIITAKQAIAKIRQNDTIAITGFVNHSSPETLINALNDCTKTNLTLFTTTCIKALENIDPKMFSTAIMGHWGLLPNFVVALEKGEMLGYNLPQGVMTKMLKSQGIQGVHSTIGLGTFIEETGGKLQAGGPVIAKRFNPTQHSQYDEPIMYYSQIDIDTAIVKVKQIDVNGKIRLCDLPTDAASILHAPCVLIEVDEILDVPFDDDALVYPGTSNQYVVLSNEDTALAAPSEARAIPPHIHSYMERVVPLVQGAKLINLGIGLPEAAVQFLPEDSKLTVEAGTIGGTPLSGAHFGWAKDPEIVMNHADMFDMYGTGVLDVSILGVGEFDMQGNVNVHDFGGKLTGCGGFIDIASAARTLIFCAKSTKLVDAVSSKTFNAQYAHDKTVYVLTENEVYKLGENGLELQ